MADNESPKKRLSRDAAGSLELEGGTGGINFGVLPDDTISLPMWYLSGKTPRPIGTEMRAGVQFLVQMAEAMLIHLVMHTVDKRFPFIIQEYEASDIDPKKPIKYRLSVDLSRLRVDAERSGEQET